MLNKEICKRCWNLTDEIIGWHEYDEERWNKGYIFCPLIYLGKEEGNIRKTTAQPPINCPYLLEYVLSN